MGNRRKFSDYFVDISKVLGEYKDKADLPITGTLKYFSDARDVGFAVRDNSKDHTIGRDTFALYTPIYIGGHLRACNKLECKIPSHSPLVVISRGVHIVIEV